MPQKVLAIRKAVDDKKHMVEWSSLLELKFVVA
jgi:hypothetical protein